MDFVKKTCEGRDQISEATHQLRGISAALLRCGNVNLSDDLFMLANAIDDGNELISNTIANDLTSRHSAMQATIGNVLSAAVNKETK